MTETKVRVRFDSAEHFKHNPTGAYQSDGEYAAYDVERIVMGNILSVLLAAGLEVEKEGVQTERTTASSWQLITVTITINAATSIRRVIVEGMAAKFATADLLGRKVTVRCVEDDTPSVTLDGKGRRVNSWNM